MKLHHVGRALFKIPYLPVLTWAGLILFGSTSAGGRIAMSRELFIEPDKLAHAIAYGVLALLLLLGNRYASAPNTRWRTALSVLFCLGFGVALEWVQYYFFPGRQFEYLDMLANAVGISLGWMTYFFIIK